MVVWKLTYFFVAIYDFLQKNNC